MLLLPKAFHLNVLVEKDVPRSVYISTRDSLEARHIQPRLLNSTHHNVAYN